MIVGALAMIALLRQPSPELVRALAPPERPETMHRIDRRIRLAIEYDETLVEQHGGHVEDFIAESVAIHNVEWRRYRREWFEIAELRFRPSGAERDASWVLANFLHRTAGARDTIHVNVVGRPLEVYTSGTSAMQIGGLAYRGSDALVVSSPPGVTPDLLAYYLFHEIGHCWEAYDIPFGGGDTTFGSKTRATFAIDAGNEEIMEDSGGPQPRDTRGRSPALLREKLARLRGVSGNAPHYARLHDLLLHEPSRSNPAYVRKKESLLADYTHDREQIVRVLQRYEMTRDHVRDEAELRHQLAEHYWRANDAIASRDYDAAEVELAAIRAISSAVPDVHMLVGAVEKRVRKRR